MTSNTTLYPIYDDTECPRCGNTEGNHDDGPYSYHPFDDQLGGTPDPRIHLMWCGQCGKPFDVAPADVPCPICGDRFHADPVDACGSNGCRCETVNRPMAEQ
jgi:DNA-directed RNA polymerase subunit RPC12/RpoP